MRRHVRHQWVHNVARAMLDLILPPRCRVCQASTIGQTTPWVCQSCWLSVAYIKPPICYQCGQPFAAPMAGIVSTVHRCATCRTTPPPYARARAVGLYQGVLRDMIHAMKYQRIFGLVHPLADMLAAQFQFHWQAPKPDLLVPVPLHRSRLRSREFDQAHALARHVGRQMAIPVIGDLLMRHRRTASQVNLDAAQRRRNVQGAFRLQKPQACKGKSLLLIDDVYTTGATARECARLLQQAGAQWIGVYTLARVG